MTRRNRTEEQLAALFVLGVLLLLPPLLVVFNRPVRVLGLPVLYLYLFVAWAALIGLTAAAVRRIGAAPTSGEGGGARPDQGAAERRPDA